MQRLEAPDHGPGRVRHPGPEPGAGVSPAKRAGSPPSSACRARFAPSPTGHLHLGNAFAALLAWLQVRSQRGVFVLRLEDLDPDRARAEYATQMCSDLNWLGLDWDEGPEVGGPCAPYVQSQRTELYRAALEQLAARGLAYPCFCSRQDIVRAAGAPHPGEEGPRYPGTCRPQPGARPTAPPSAHRLQPAWRFRAVAGTVAFADGILGAVAQDVAATTGDFVIWRRENVAAYQLAVAVDDAAMGITHVVRGADLVDSTPRQILIHRSLGLPVPNYAHVPLLLGPDGQRLAKRHGPVSLAELRQRGVAATAVVGWLAAWAGLTRTAAAMHPRALVPGFCLDRLPRQPVQVSAADLAALTERAGP